MDRLIVFAIVFFAFLYYWPYVVGAMWYVMAAGALNAMGM